MANGFNRQNRGFQIGNAAMQSMMDAYNRNTFMMADIQRFKTSTAFREKEFGLAKSRLDLATERHEQSEFKQHQTYKKEDARLRGFGVDSNTAGEFESRFMDETNNAGFDESGFQTWYKGHAETQGINPDPDDPKHKYDYRAAYKAGVGPDDTGHWPSEFKDDDHPNRFIDGVDTKITGFGNQRYFEDMVDGKLSWRDKETGAHFVRDPSKGYELGKQIIPKTERRGTSPNPDIEKAENLLVETGQQITQRLNTYDKKAYGDPDSRSNMVEEIIQDHTSALGKMTTGSEKLEDLGPVDRQDIGEASIRTAFAIHESNADINEKIDMAFKVQDKLDINLSETITEEYVRDRAKPTISQLIGSVLRSIGKGVAALAPPIRIGMLAANKPLTPVISYSSSEVNQITDDATDVVMSSLRSDDPRIPRAILAASIDNDGNPVDPASPEGITLLKLKIREYVRVDVRKQVRKATKYREDEPGIISTGLNKIGKIASENPIPPERALYYLRR